MRESMTRWLKFSTAGSLGVAVQLGSLAFLIHVLAVPYLFATGMAVEVTVLHNFLWHRRWTWADRQGAWLPTLLRFNLSNGAVSIVGNVALMRGLAGYARLGPVLANLLSVAICSFVNYLLADRFVFVSASPPAASEGTADCATLSAFGKR